MLKKELVYGFMNEAGHYEKVALMQEKGRSEVVLKINGRVQLIFPNCAFFEGWLQKCWDLREELRNGL